MKKLLLTLLILSMCGITHLVYAAEVIVDYSEQSIPILNEELRRLQENIPTIPTPTRVIVWYISGDADIVANKSAYIIIPFPGTIVKATAYAKTVPTGANLIFDINKNDTTIWSTQANRLQIAISANSGSTTTFDTTSVTTNDYFTVDIDQIGTTVAGTDITIQLYIEETV